MADVTLEPGETVVLDTLGDIGKGVGFAKGRVVLTTQRLLLRPDGFNLDNRPSDVALADVASVEAFNILGFIPWGVTLRCRDGRVQKLRVMGRDRLVAAIRRGAGV
ncbi:hypothetical protein [Devosia sp. 2618]|uniref:hypothetical protein n=1 Tax=Devosia sp. 2618 TaxID=3156454 RepID=UPI00339B2B18